MKALEDGPLRLPALSDRDGEAILALQRAVSRRARYFEELIPEIAKPVPVSRAHQLASLQTHSRRRRHPNANLNGVSADLLQGAVVTLAQKAEEKVDDRWL